MLELLEIGLKGRQIRSILVCKAKVKLRDVGWQGQARKCILLCIILVSVIIADELWADNDKANGF